MSVTPLSVADRLETTVDPIAAGSDAEARVRAITEFLPRVLPDARAHELESTARFPDAELRAFATEGHVAPFVPRAHGGAFDWPTAMRVAFRLAAHDLDTALCFGGTVLATTPLFVAASEAQAATPFAAVLRGEMGAFALTEWEHGSDLAANEARAVPIVDGRAEAHAFRLRGRKAPANNGSRSAFVVVLLRTSDDPGPFAHSLFLLDRARDRLGAHPPFPSLGHRSMDLSGVVLDDVELPRSALLGPLGEGFVLARRALEISRGGVAMLGAGVCAVAAAHAVRHARERILYGARIGDLGGVQTLVGGILARALEAIAACRRTAWALGRAARSARTWTSLAKLLSPRLAEECVHDAGTVLGARSLMEDLPFARLRRAAPVLAIFDGSSQLQLDEIWRGVTSWSDVTDLAPGALDAHLRAIDLAAPFDAGAEDDGLLARAHPASELALLDAQLPGRGLGALGEAARQLGVLAGSLRGAPQATRFRVSEAASRLFGIAALAEALARTGDDLLDDALAVRIAAGSPHVAAALVEVTTALDRPLPHIDLLPLARHAGARAASCYARFDALV